MSTITDELPVCSDLLGGALEDRPPHDRAVRAPVGVGTPPDGDVARPPADPFDVFFRTHHADAYRFALQMVGDPARAEDVASEVLVKVFLRLQRGGIDTPEAYLRRAVVNQATSWFRRLHVERRWLARQRPPEDTRTPLDERIVQADALRDALLRLPARQRAAIVLRYYEDLSEADTAAALGCSVGTVKSTVHRGITRLRALLGPTLELADEVE